MPVWSADCARVVIEVSSASPASDAPVWVDITGWGLPRGNGAPIEIYTGRQDETSQSQPSRMSLALNNADNRFTPHNPLSPYYPWWEQGRRIRVRETMGPFTFDLFDGYIEMPQVVIRPPDDVDNVVTLTAVDRLGRLERARTFVSVLGEHILFHGRSSLVAYFPMNESSGPAVRDRKGRASLTETYAAFQSAGAADSQDGLLSYAAADPLPGDDLRGVVYSPVLGGSGEWNVLVSHRGALPSFTVSTGESVAVAFWIKWTPGVNAGSSDLVTLTVPELPGGFLRVRKGPGAVVAYDVSALDDAVNSGSFASSALPSGSWQLVTVRMTMGTGLCELWVADRTNDSAMMSPATSATFSQLDVGFGCTAAIEHLQVYAGTGAFTYEDHLAQCQVGLLGLDRQRVDERIRTILHYAGTGVTDAQMQLEVSPTVMPQARWAGRAPMDLVREAVASDGGVIFTDGPEIVFQSRKHRYNV